MRNFRRLINRLIFNREAQAKPYRILWQIEGDPERHCWDYCATPADAVGALLWWQQCLTAKGFEVCRSDTYWIIFHLPERIQADLVAMNAVAHADLRMVPMPDAEVRPPHHGGGTRKRHMMLSIVNTTVGESPSLEEFIHNRKYIGRVFFGVN